MEGIKMWNISCYCVCLFLVKYERIKFLVIALKNSVEIYAWAPKPYHKFMAFKVLLRNHVHDTHILDDSIFSDFQ